MRGNTAQVLLITAGILVASLFGIFLYREVFPEYKIYQNDYISLEEFRSIYTHQSLPPFQLGVKQIVIEREDKGPAIIDRCTSCHVALQIPYFSTTKIDKDLNGNIVKDTDGHPLLVPNEDYIWKKLDIKIAELRDKDVLNQLISNGENAQANQRLSEAAKYESLKTAYIGDQVYDVTKVLAMHPLMGNETYPFQYHPIEEYGCTSCHNGNGRGLVTDKAHGPVFDGRYDIEEEVRVPYFTEPDSKNDPRFAHIFNYKPSEELIFQTEPIYIGALIQAKCVQCHQTSHVKLAEADTTVSDMTLKQQQKIKILSDAYQNELQTLSDLLQLNQLIESEGYAQTLNKLLENENDFSLPTLKLEQLASQVKYLKDASKGQPEVDNAKKNILTKLNSDLVNLIGSNELVSRLKKIYSAEGDNGIASFLKKHQRDSDANGILFTKGAAIDLGQDLMRHAHEAQLSFSKAASDQKLMSAIVSDVDELTRDFQRGKELYISQACYACHRISGFSRGGIGPELTRSGNSYPWFLKRKLVWPQADLSTSTMPNMHFDTKELEDLMTYLLSLKGPNRSVSKTNYQSKIQSWEAGNKIDLEKPISPTQIYDLRYAMTMYATQGCAACHRLKGFESNVGFAVEKDANLNPELIFEQQEWFRKLFPEVLHYSFYDEEMPGSEIVAVIDQHANEIDDRIINNVRQNSILEEINLKHPETLESLYSPLRYALRAKNAHYKNLIDNEKDAKKIATMQQEWDNYKDRVHRVMMMYIQVYGLGRLIGPHLNWSGIFRSDEWLMEHFHNPPAHVPRSLMPVFPFDDTKFYALTHMLDVLAVRNRNTLRQFWNLRGFDPAETYEMLCSQCHGVGMAGNGVIAEWIYPIPKNLHNPEFLRNLTKEQAQESIKHGVKGTPMSPWGEVATDKGSDIEKISRNTPVLKESEIKLLVDWFFTGLSGGEIFKKAEDVPKWQYTPEDVIEELKQEGGRLFPPSKDNQRKDQQNINPHSGLLKENDVYYASTNLEKSYSPYSSNSNSEYSVESIFDEVTNPYDKRRMHYYIKKEFYTPENIEQGQKFFLLNCAVCHGNEADGTGTRSQAMKEAKPRMLTNLDWINSKDDLRLLRSIKYGVPGTSMTPWGDLTNSMQRLQLVMFIRSLTREREQRTNLLESLYHSFESPQLIIENARIQTNFKIEQLNDKMQKLNIRKQILEDEIKEGRNSLESAVEVYKQMLEVEKEINGLVEYDQMLNSLKSKLKTERELYYQIGMGISSKEISEADEQHFFDLVRMNGQRYSLQGDQLVVKHEEDQKKLMRETRQLIIDEFDRKISELEGQRRLIEGKINSAHNNEDLNAIQLDIDGYKKLRAKLITETEEAFRLADDQSEIVKKLNAKTNKNKQ